LEGYIPPPNPLDGKTPDEIEEMFAAGLIELTPLKELEEV
jgi:hypothetical protein